MINISCLPGKRIQYLHLHCDENDGNDGNDCKMKESWSILGGSENGGIPKIDCL